MQEKSQCSEEKILHNMKVEIYKSAVSNLFCVSEQRLKFIRFYIAFIAFLVSVITFTSLKSQQLHTFSFFVIFIAGIVLLVITYIFKLIDKRNVHLLNTAKESVKAFEQEYINRLPEEDFSPARISNLCFITKDEENQKNTVSIGSQINNIFIIGTIISLLIIILSAYGYYDKNSIESKHTETQQASKKTEL